MFLTKECDYAIRIVRSLADMEMKPVKTICVEEHMPLPFAYKILKKLENARFVKSYRGSTGGYQLVRNPDTITLLSIVASIDDHLFLNECILDDYICDNNRSGKPCAVHEELNRMQALLFDALSEKKLSELV
jgi:Rrf2 family protein